MTDHGLSRSAASPWSLVRPPDPRSLSGRWGLVVVGIFALAAGCTGKPNAANIKLRKENQELAGQVDRLQRERDAARAEAAGLRDQKPSVPTLPADRLQKLFTAHGITLGKLTGGDDFDPAKPGDDGLKVYATPIDAAGQTIKAAGAFVVEAFDLAGEGNTRVGRWQFPVEQAPALWNGTLWRYEYVLPCPFDQRPAHAELTVKVTFTDELTGRAFTEQRVVKVRLSGK
jgi:outer membrane murein-binding lipoprotein Lpp